MSEDALKGAAKGAAMGSVVPGWGTAVGAGLGALGGYLSGGDEEDSTGRRDQAHKHLQNQMIQQALMNQNQASPAMMQARAQQRQAVAKGQAAQAAGGMASPTLGAALAAKAGSGIGRQLATGSAEEQVARQKMLVNAIAQQGVLDMKTEQEQAVQTQAQQMIKELEGQIKVLSMKLPVPVAQIRELQAQIERLRADSAPAAPMLGGGSAPEARE